MEPCGQHSGVIAIQDEQRRRMDKYEDNVVRIHKRIDDLADSMNGLESRIVEKITEYADTMNEHHLAVMALYEKDAEPRISALERNQSMAWKAIVWTGGGIVALIGFLRAEFGKFAKWFFFGG